MTYFVELLALDLILPPHRAMASFYSTIPGMLLCTKPSSCLVLIASLKIPVTTQFLSAELQPQLQDDLGASYAAFTPPFDVPIALILFLLLIRHNNFQWTTAILASTFVLGGTLLCVLQIYLQRELMNVEYYFIHSQLSWSACIVLDGRHIFNLWCLYGRAPLCSLRRMGLRRTVCATLGHTLELVGLLLCCLSMTNLAIDVYGNFHKLTQSLLLYTCFFIAATFKIGRILFQGELAI